MSKQVYLDLVDGHHIKVTPLGWDVFKLVDREYQCVLVRVDEGRYGFQKGEELQCQSRSLFCIAGVHVCWTDEDGGTRPESS